MQETTPSQLHDETSAWCARAQRLTKREPPEAPACLELVREGIILRRRWDLLDRDSPPRRRLLTLLAAAQTVCHRQLAETLTGQIEPQPRRVEQVIRRLAEDDRYLADLLDDHTLPPLPSKGHEDAPPYGRVAFAVECFRDDLHWLGTLVALLDGNRGVDFTGRVLLEQESLQRTFQSWEADTASADSTEASEEASDELCQSARQLRATALVRRAESLLGQPEPQDWVATTTAQASTVLSENGIWNLLYTGFDTTGCVWRSAGGMWPMSKLGYRTILLRDCSAGAETAETFPTEGLTKAWIQVMEMQVATAVSSDLLEAIR